jgi:hypothetical protein
MYYNTNDLSSGDLAKAVRKNASQNEIVKDFFKSDYNLHKRAIPYSPEEICEILKLLRIINPNTPLTSIRRAMSDLSSDKHFRFLVKTSSKRKSASGGEEHKWIINIEHIKDGKA